MSQKSHEVYDRGGGGGGVEVYSSSVQCPKRAMRFTTGGGGGGEGIFLLRGPNVPPEADRMRHRKLVGIVGLEI